MTRLGFLLPSVNAVLEPDVARLLAGDEELSGHFSRVLLPRNSEAEIAAMIERLASPTAELVHAGVDVVGFACTAGGLIGGRGHDRRIADLIGEQTGLPSTTTITAVVEALRLMEMEKIVLLAPYEEWLVEREVAFLRSAGFDVVAEIAMGLPDPRDCEAVSPAEIHQIVVDADVPDADGAFVSCADFQALAAVEAIERDAGKPVVTSNQAVIWDMLRRVGSDRAFDGFGRLLRRPDLEGERS